MQTLPEAMGRTFSRCTREARDVSVLFHERIKKISNMEHAESFGDQYVKQLKEFFCDEVKFTAHWEEAQGEEFSAPSLGDEEELKSQCTSYRRFVFRNFMEKNPETESPWRTKDVLVSLLTKNIPTWLQPNTILYHIINSFFKIRQKQQILNV